MSQKKPVYISASFVEVTPHQTYLVRSNSGIFGFVKPYTNQEIPEEGKRLQVKVYGYNGSNGNSTTFFGRVRFPRGLKESVGV